MIKQGIHFTGKINKKNTEMFLPDDCVITSSHMKIPEHHLVTLVQSVDGADKAQAVFTLQKTSPLLRYTHHHHPSPGMSEREHSAIISQNALQGGSLRGPFMPFLSDNGD